MRNTIRERQMRSWMEGNERRRELSVIAGVWLLTLTVMLMLGHLVVLPKLVLSGDEPEYLLISHSIYYDHDLDLKNNYNHRDYLRFFPFQLQPHRALNPGDQLYSFHAPGLPFIAVPFYLAGGRGGVVVLLNLCAALLAVQLYRLARRTGASRFGALAAWISISFTLPVSIYSSMVYPEIPGALLYLSSLLLVLGNGDTGVPTRCRLILAGVMAGVLPWFHIRYAVLGVTLVGCCCLLHRRQRTILTFLAPYVALSGLFLWHQYSMFGHPFHLLMFADASSFTPAALKGMTGIIAGRVFGLLPHAPVYLLALAGWYLLLVTDRRRFLLFTGLAAPYFYI
ncbi:hypothetical protein JW905_03610, partial [bacterium]|nr:hypothetical protein [candidate division CSSED10-310 bacterium]